MPYVDKMFDLFNDSYASLSSFVAISDTQKNISKKIYQFYKSGIHQICRGQDHK
jgi:hypothetical protein